jgi:transketolase
MPSDQRRALACRAVRTTRLKIPAYSATRSSSTTAFSALSAQAAEMPCSAANIATSTPTTIDTRGGRTRGMNETPTPTAIPSQTSMAVGLRMLRA